MAPSQPAYEKFFCIKPNGGRREVGKMEMGKGQCDPGSFQGMCQVQGFGSVHRQV